MRASMTEDVKRLAIRVRKSRGEEIRRSLLDMGELDTTLRIGKDGDFLLFPLREDTRLSENIENGRLWGKGIGIVSLGFEKIKERMVGGYRECLNGLPEGSRPFLPSSFDVIGDLVVIKLQREVEPFGGNIASAILESHPGIRGVFQDLGVKGSFRIRVLRHLAGENRTLTIHKEYDMRLKTDIAKVYFTPRLAGERHRLSRMIGKSERVLDMFAGIGPFSIALARASPASEIHAVDANPDAIILMEENIRLNKVENIIPHQGDARELTPALGGKRPFDRALMNLPHSSLEFLDTVLDVMGYGWIHLYDILKRDELK
ncbi:MAG: class I SAM-dependent methyltransferase family protein, partial [Thermoplasmata archaeon]|nr:class I SAM-dependent methyltransferase family protein [Thermoplasmata archaeon]